MRFERWRRVAAAMTVAVAAAVPAAGAESCVIDTALHWVDVGGAVPFAYDTASAELSAVLGGHGVCADVARASPNAVRAGGAIGVILLPSLGAAGAGQRVMGAMRRGGQQTASIWVYFDEVASTLGLRGRAPQAWTPAERSRFARALGRVAAHEVIHALLPARPHDAFGLMAPSLGHDELTAPTLAADPRLIDDLRRLGPAGRAADRSWRASR